MGVAGERERERRLRRRIERMRMMRQKNGKLSSWRWRMSRRQML